MFFMTSFGPLTDNISMQYARAYQKNYGAMRSFGSIGVGTASLVLGILIGVVGIDYLGWMYASIMIVAIPLIFLIEEKRNEQTKSDQPAISFKSIKKLLENKRYIWVVILGLLILTPHKMNDSLYTIYLSEMGAKEQQVGLAWMLATFSSVPLFILTGVLIKRF
jgi:PPP family 3-phenylpropionic acid transporter